MNETIFLSGFIAGILFTVFGQTIVVGIIVLCFWIFGKDVKEDESSRS